MLVVLFQAQYLEPVKLLSRKTWEIVDKYYSDKFNFPSSALIVVQRCNCYVCKGWVTLKATVKAEYEATNNCLNSVHHGNNRWQSACTSDLLAVSCDNICVKNRWKTRLMMQNIFKLQHKRQQKKRSSVMFFKGRQTF